MSRIGIAQTFPSRNITIVVPYVPGALVNVVGRGSPAEAAGLRSNDVIVELGGRAIETYRRLPSAVALLRPGEKAKVVFLRQGRRQETVVTLGSQGGGLPPGRASPPSRARATRPAGVTETGARFLSALESHL